MRKEESRKQRSFSEVKHKHDNSVASLDSVQVHKSIIDITAPINKLFAQQNTQSTAS